MLGYADTHSQVPPNVIEPVAETESFDFGSCVALHRFLYDHWDHVRQKIVIRDRKAAVRSLNNDGSQGNPILEALRDLITNLGPPPMDVSWNRPAISANTPPSYSRFQHFMLRNAGRNPESLVSTRAVYDGGESKVCHPSLFVPSNPYKFKGWSSYDLYHSSQCRCRKHRL